MITQPKAKSNDYWAELEEMDRGSILHPFTVLKDFAEGRQRPRIVTGGKGVFIRDQDGRELLDAFAGLYCVNIGYGRADVAEAIARQAHELAYYHSYAGVSSEALIRLSDRLVKMAPGKMSKVFYGLSGSDARSGCGSSSYGWKYSTGKAFSAATSRSALRSTEVGSARQYAPPPIGTGRPRTGQTVTGYSQISRPPSSSSRYGVRGTPRIRFGMRGESYWLES